MFLERGEP